MGPNLSDITRKGLFFGYGFRWLQPMDYIEMPDRLIEKADPIQRQLLGGTVAKDLGGDYDPGILQSWLEEETRSSAANVVSSIGDGLQHALDQAEPGTPPAETARSHFASLETDRVPELAQTRVTTIGGKASRDAARVAGAAHKTWHVMSSRPRASHAAMSGKTAPLGEPAENSGRSRTPALPIRLRCAQSRNRRAFPPRA